MKLGELFYNLGFNIDSKALTEFDNKLTGVRNSLGVISLEATGALYAVDRFIGNITAGSVALKNFNMLTGMSIEDINELTAAGLNLNIGIDKDQGLLPTLQNVANIMSQLKQQGNIGQGPLGRLGIDKNALMSTRKLKDYWELISDAVRKHREAGDMSPIDEAQWLQQLGIGANLIPLLEKTIEERKELAKGLTLSKQEQEEIFEISKEYNTLTLETSNTFKKMAIEYAPQIKQAFAWVKENLPQILHYAKLFAEALVGVAVLSGLASVIKSLTVILGLFFDLRKVMAVILLFTIENPIVAIILGITAAVAALLALTGEWQPPEWIKKLLGIQDAKARKENATVHTEPFSIDTKDQIQSLIQNQGAATSAGMISVAGASGSVVNNTNASVVINTTSDHPHELGKLSLEGTQKALKRAVPNGVKPLNIPSNMDLGVTDLVGQRGILR